MPFGIEFDYDYVNRDIVKSIDLFNRLYIKNFNYNILKSKSNNNNNNNQQQQQQLNEKKLKENPELLEFPQYQGEMKIKLGASKWKSKYFWIKGNGTLAYGSGPNPLIEEESINLWSYKVRPTNRKPEKQRRGGPDWIPDEEAPFCKLCNKKFSAVIWHHHCRNCGYVFCSECSNQKMILPPHFGYNDKPQRVCKDCFAVEVRRKSIYIKPNNNNDNGELKDNEFHGIELISSSRTPYILQCNSLQDKKKWISILEFCALNSRDPLSHNDIERSTFLHSFAQLSWTFGEFSVVKICGSEAEMLIDLFIEHIKTSTIKPKVEQSNIEKKRHAEIEITKQCLKLLREKVPEIWYKKRNDIINNQINIENQLNDEFINEIDSKVNECRNKLEKMTIDIFKDVIIDSIKTMKDTFMINKLPSLIVEVFLSLFASCNTYIRLNASNIQDWKSFNQFLTNFNDEIRKQDGCLKDVYTQVAQLYDKLHEVNELYSISDFINTFNECIIQFTQNIIYTFKTDDELLNEAIAMNGDRVLNVWSSKISKDMQFDATIQFIYLFKRKILVEDVQNKTFETILRNIDISRSLTLITDELSNEHSKFINISTIYYELLMKHIDIHIDEVYLDLINEHVDKIRSFGARSVAESVCIVAPIVN